MNRLTNPIAAKDRRIEELATQNRVAEQQSELFRSWKKDYDKLNEEYEQLKNDLDYKEACLNESQATLASFQNAKSQDQEVIRQLREQLIAAESSKSSLQTELSHVQEEYKLLRTSSATFEEQLSGSRKYISRLEAEVANLRKGFDETMNRLKNYHSDDNGCVS